MPQSTQQESDYLQLKTFICKICKQEFELLHDREYKLSGIILGKNLTSEIHNITICEYCACELANVDEAIETNLL